MYLLAKIAITALLVAAISELSRRYNLMAALLASLPLTSLLAFIWIYIETKDTAKIIEMSQSIFWLVIPSLVLFIALPLLLKGGMDFWLALLASCVATVVAYGVTLAVWKAVQ